MEDPIRVCRDCFMLVHLDEVSQFIKDTDLVICAECAVVRPVSIEHPAPDAVQKKIQAWMSRKRSVVT